MCYYFYIKININSKNKFSSYCRNPTGFLAVSIAHCIYHTNKIKIEGRNRFEVDSETRGFSTYSDKVSSKKLGQIFFKSTLKTLGRVRGVWFLTDYSQTV